MENFRMCSGTGYRKLADDIFKFDPESESNDILKIDKFKDGEILPMFKESVRYKDVFFINSTDSSDSIMETILVSDAAKRAGCNSFTLVAPYQGYSRQDKTDHLRSSIGSRVLADILEKSGVNRLITIDLHASSIEGFYNIPVIHLNGYKIFVEEIKSKKLDNLCIVAPDQGAVKRANDFCKSFPEASFAMINKKRIVPNEIHSMRLVGDVEGKNVIIVDDMADTLGTMKTASELVMDMGANSVRAVATHGILSGNAINNLEASKLSEILISDTIQSTQGKGVLSNKINIVSCAKIIHRSIHSILNKQSINETISRM
jgi:ribose-phosphate pyrophosphokinase